MRAGGWAFILAATGFVVFALFLAFSRFGKIRLGTDAEKPEFRTVSWIAMMFSAGMGIGLMFFGVNEPLSFFTTAVPPGAAEPLTTEAANVAMATSLFHWTLHPWAIYAVVGLAIAYSTFRKGRRQLISQAFIPLIGKRAAEGGIGKAIDILAIFATLFGSAASLGIGAYQIAGGLKAGGFTEGEPGPAILATIIVVLTAAFVLSAVSGIARGIQWLSNINMVLAGILALFVFVLGPTVIILDLIPTSIGAYFTDFFEMVGRTEASGGEPMLDWLSSWTVFYWAWWISWTPFVGMFLARISRGRTIREFVGGVILAPSLVSLVWFVIFGGTAIFQAKPVADGGLGRTFSDDSNAQLFEVLQAYPFATFTGLLVMILVGIFFVSGADAASIVMGTLSQRGTIEPSRWIVIFWGSVMGAVAVLMLITGGEDALNGIQNLTILVAAPFVVIMIMLCFALSKRPAPGPDDAARREGRGDHRAGCGLRDGTARRGLLPARAGVPGRQEDRADRDRVQQRSRDRSGVPDDRAGRDRVRRGRQRGPPRGRRGAGRRREVGRSAGAGRRRLRTRPGAALGPAGETPDGRVGGVSAPTRPVGLRVRSGTAPSTDRSRIRCDRVRPRSLYPSSPTENPTPSREGSVMTARPEQSGSLPPRDHEHGGT